MLKIIKGLGIAVAGITMVTGLASCAQESTITRYTRDTDSGTREGFFEKIGFKDASKDNTLIPGAVEVSGNGTMLTSIEGDEFGIGYVSLASVTSDVKALKFEGVEATEDNVINGTYTLTRNFNYVTRTADDMTETEKLLVDGFLKYADSKEGLAIIKAQSGIIASDAITNAKSWETIINEEENASLKALCDATRKTKIYFGGSTSVEKMAKALSTAFANVCKGFEANHTHTGSSDAFKRTQGTDKDSQNKLHIGFLSRDLKLTSDEKAQENSYGKMCVDGIAVIVNKANTKVDNLTAAQLKEIYSTENTTWDSLA